MNNYESHDLKPATTKNAATITSQGMIVVRKTRLRATHLVSGLEEEMHHPHKPVAGNAR